MSLNRLRLIRPAPDPLGLYIRAGREDQKSLLSFIAAGDASLSGVVLEAKRVTTHAELLTQVLDHRLDAVLDPLTQPMGTAAGYSASMDALPWSAKRAHTPGDFKYEIPRRKMAESIATFVVEHGFTQVLAPTHLLAGPDDPWLEIDIATTNMLRAALDRRGASAVQILYSSAISYDTFRTPAKRENILNELRRVHADAVWLNVEGCGSVGTGTRVIRYAGAANDFQSLGKPLVADHVGGVVGLALLAFGAVGGIAHGVTLGERFSTAHWHKKPTGTPLAQHTRVYIPQLDWQLQRINAEKFFESGAKAKATFGCHDSRCCSRGITGMLNAPARHFLYQRTREVGGLSQIPESLRPQRFLEEHVRAASDRALLATKLDLPEALAKKAIAQSKRLDAMRIELAEYARKHRDATFAQHPRTRAAREARG